MRCGSWVMKLLLVYFIDDGPIGIHETPIAAKHKLPDKASLVARDAYNGVILWKRPVADWGANAFAGDLIKRWRERDRNKSELAIAFGGLSVALPLLEGPTLRFMQKGRAVAMSQSCSTVLAALLSLVLWPMGIAPSGVSQVLHSRN